MLPYSLASTGLTVSIAAVFYAIAPPGQPEIDSPGGETTKRDLTHEAQHRLYHEPAQHVGRPLHGTLDIWLVTRTIRFLETVASPLSFNQWVTPQTLLDMNSGGLFKRKPPAYSDFELIGAFPS